MSILIVDDDKNIRWVLSQFLQGKGFEVLQAEDGRQAIDMWQQHSPKLVLLDYRLPDMTGLDVYRTINEQHPDNDSEVIVITSHGETKIIVESMRLGAADFIDKPFDIEEVGFIINNALEKKDLKEEVKTLKHELGQDVFFDDFIGSSSTITHIKDMIRQIADINATLLLLGESGTGKDKVARILHNYSNRNHKKFIKVNCAALPEQLLESELFGFEKGAFSGALKRKKGKFELADEGTIYLDEIGEMTPHLQAKLLQVLQDKSFSPLGSEKEIHCDSRIVAATNIDIEQAVNEGSFRADLYYRLNVVHINIPPLRQHPEDIPLLTENFLVKFSKEFNREVTPIAPQYIDMLMGYTWPGNVRQLENVIKQFVIFQNESVFEHNLRQSVSVSKPLPQQPSSMKTDSAKTQKPTDGDGSDSSLSLKEVSKKATIKAERELINQVLSQTDWNRTETAKILQISYKSLLNKIKETGLDNRTDDLDD